MSEPDDTATAVRGVEALSVLAELYRLYHHLPDPDADWDGAWRRARALLDSVDTEGADGG